MNLRTLVVCSDQDATGLLPLIQSEMATEAEHTSSTSRGMELVDRQHFGAIVVDYRADESSEELLARLRSSAKNRNSLLIALVDDEVNARLVFSLGAGFVLFRPLSSERTRISLRVARNLLNRERRRVPRTPVGTAASVAYPGAPELNTVLANLSDGGATIHTANRIPANCKVYFEFALPGQPQLVRLSGEVAWRDASGRTGIRFLDVPQPSRRLMQTWLDKKSVGSAGQTLDQRMETDSQSGAPLSAENLRTASARDKKLARQTGGLLSSGGNRRDGKRFPCKLGAEVYAVGTTIPNRCTLSDISEGGCYVEMPSPLTGDPKVEIVVRTADTKFRIQGEVLTTHPGFGMGVRFLLRNSAEREEVQRLLGVLALIPAVEK